MIIMAISKVVYGENTLIDLTSDTVNEKALLNGYIAHDKSGSSITGTVTFITVHNGSSAPSSSIGSDGDVYLVV